MVKPIARNPVRPLEGARKKHREVERPIHEAILRFMYFQYPRAAVHHSPNEVDASGANIARAINKAKKMGMRPGWPDLEMLWLGNFWTLEVKAPGNKPTKSQLECRDIIEANGGRWACVTSVDEAKAVLDEWRREATAALEHRGTIT